MLQNECFAYKKSPKDCSAYVLYPENQRQVPLLSMILLLLAA